MACDVWSPRALNKYFREIKARIIWSSKRIITPIIIVAQLVVVIQAISLIIKSTRPVAIGVVVVIPTREQPPPANKIAERGDPAASAGGGRRKQRWGGERVWEAAKGDAEKGSGRKRIGWWKALQGDQARLRAIEEN